MRKTLPALSAVLLLAVSAVSGWSQDDDLEQAPLEFEGMTCGSCAESIAAALQEVEGVRAATVDFDSALARVSYDPGVASPDKLIKAVKEIGYAARVREPGDEAAPASAHSAPSCAAGGSSAATFASTLSAEELERVAEYVAKIVIETGRTGFEDEEIEAATGVAVGDADGPAIRRAVMAKLTATEKGRQMLAGSRCQAYEACSLYGDLSGASGEILAMYEREKAEDGRLFEDFELPEFEAFDLAGNEVSSADLRGQPVLLAFLAVHCRHSMDSLPILQKLEDTYGPQGLRVVAIAINSGGVEDVNTWFPSFEPTYDVWVANGDALGDRIGSHLVPTYLFVDPEGRITEKLVGYKEPAAVTERVLAYVAPRGTPEPAPASP